MFALKLCALHGTLPRCVRSTLPLCSQASLLHTHTAQQNSNKTSLMRYNRQKYERLYPVLLVREDGSTVNIRYGEPRRVLMMPIDVTTLSEESRRTWRRKRQAAAAATVTKVADRNEDDDFEAESYSQFWDKK